jgi:pimeloyl-ACP methyl ester carboxylesterase
MRIMAVCLMLLITAAFTAAQPENIAVTPLEIALDDFTTQAELTTPPGDGPFPTVILLHGSGPYDMDATYQVAPGVPALSANFRLLAERLPEQGIAVLRFNKRGVLGNGEYDFEQVQRSTLDQLVVDANSVIDTAQALPQVGAIYVYGWSEGGVVAANVAAGREDIAGLILQAAPNGSVADVLPYQHLDLGLPYLLEHTDADGDGLLTLDELATIPAGPVALLPSFYIYAFTSTPDQPAFNPQTDTNGDEQIDIEGELRPAIERTIELYPNFLPPSEASWAVASLVAALDIPTLIVHGEQDGWVPSAMGREIAEAAPETVTLHLYEGLGHALSETEHPAEDAFTVMHDAPIADIAAWVNAQA